MSKKSERRRKRQQREDAKVKAFVSAVASKAAQKIRSDPVLAAGRRMEVTRPDWNNIWGQVEQLDRRITEVYRQLINCDATTSGAMICTLQKMQASLLRQRNELQLPESSIPVYKLTSYQPHDRPTTGERTGSFEAWNRS